MRYWRDSLAPLATEAEILRAYPDEPRLFRFADNPAILVLVVNDLAMQGEMLNRVAALIEKRGLPRDRVLSPDELAAAIADAGATPATWYYGHDYSQASLRRFVTLASQTSGGMTAAERRLVAMIDRVAPQDASAGVALITLPRAGLDPLLDEAARATILRHELSHGEFFTTASYAGHVMQFWREGLNAAQRAAFTAFLAHEEYDPDNEALLANEMQAYLVHTADPRFFNAEAMGLPEAEIAELRRRFVAGMPQGWLRSRSLRPRRRHRATVSRSSACPDRLRPAFSAASRAARRLRK